MDEKLISNIKKYLISFVVMGAASIGVLALRKFGAELSGQERYLDLADAFTIPGVVLIMVGALVWISGEGMFDSLSYLGRSIFWIFNQAKPVRYYEYIQEKRAKRKKGGWGFLLLTGAAFMAVALVYLALFYKVFEG